MKKIEADLVSIAHRILQLKQVWRQSIVFGNQKLYEKLSVLRSILIGLHNPRWNWKRKSKRFMKSTDLPIETIIEMTDLFL
jgi:hypothetical protein